MSDYIYGWSDQQDLYARAMQRINQALLLNPDQATAHYAKAVLLMIKAKPNDAALANEVIAEAEATLRADPSFARAYHPMAVGEILLGHYEQSMSDLEQAMRISPRDPCLELWHMEMGRQFLALQSNRCGGPGRPQGHRLGDIERVGLRGPCGVLCGGGQAAGGEGRAGGGDEIESQTLRGVA